MNSECFVYGKNILVVGVNGRVIIVKLWIIIGNKFRCNDAVYIWLPGSIDKATLLYRFLFCLL
jgi:hypothetical protein